MTTRGYEHQRRPQAREGQSKAVWPTNWAYTPVTIRGGGRPGEGEPSSPPAPSREPLLDLYSRDAVCGNLSTAH